MHGVLLYSRGAGGNGNETERWFRGRLWLWLALMEIGDEVEGC